MTGCPLDGEPDDAANAADAEDTVDDAFDGPAPAPASAHDADPPPRRFGEEGALLTYGSYLRVPELLQQQHLKSNPPAHDELLFITIHQTYELWFQQLLHDLDSTRQAMFDGRLWWARHLLQRARVIEDVLVMQLGVIEKMTPQDFLEFRSVLSPASGFQSVQFRELEFLSGKKDARYLSRFKGVTDEERARLDKRLAEPTLWDAFVAALAAADLAVGDDRQILDSLLVVARDRATYGELWDLAEALLDHDEAAGMWRARHVMMVERQIGTKSGTGGSTGAPYLRSRVGVKYFPLLWELRAWL